MLQGKVRAALQILANDSKGGPMPIDTRLPSDHEQPAITVWDELKKKVNQHTWICSFPQLPPDQKPILSSLTISMAPSSVLPHSAHMVLPGHQESMRLDGDAFVPLSRVHLQLCVLA